MKLINMKISKMDIFLKNFPSGASSAVPVQSENPKFSSEFAVHAKGFR